VKHTIEEPKEKEIKKKTVNNREYSEVCNLIVFVLMFFANDTINVSY